MRFSSGKNIILLFVILIILISMGVVVLVSMRTDPIEIALSSDNIVKVLFVIEEENIPISNNIIAYYPETKRAAMFDIPSNTGLILQDLGRTDAIGALYTEKGIQEYKREIEKLTGISIPFYITCNLNEFSRMTDMLSGLSVFIPTSIDEVIDEKRILLPSGSVVLDGDKMRDYLLYEDELDSSMVAIDRRQKAIIAFLRGVNDNQAIFNDNQFKIFSSLLHSNLRRSDFKQVLAEICKLDSERLVPQRVTGASRKVDEKVLLFPFRDGQQIKEIIRQTFAALASEDGTILERVYAIEILNGTESRGLAKRTSDLYQSFGYDVIRVGNVEDSIVDKTVLIDRIGNLAVAQIVGKVIQCGNIETAHLSEDEQGMETSVDFTLILGKDFNGDVVRK